MTFASTSAQPIRNQRGAVAPLSDAELARVRTIVLQRLEFADRLQVDEPTLRLVYRLAAAEQARRDQERASA